MVQHFLKLIKINKSHWIFLLKTWHENKFNGTKVQMYVTILKSQVRSCHGTKWLWFENDNNSMNLSGLARL